jgi:hypothetical protein
MKMLILVDDTGNFIRNVVTKGMDLNNKEQFDYFINNFQNEYQNKQRHHQRTPSPIRRVQSNPITFRD